MKKDFGLGRITQLAAAATVTCIAATAAVAATPPVVSVAVFADHYVIGGRYIDDLDTLEDAIAGSQARGVRLESCGEGTSRAHLAAAHRFRNLYLDLRIAGIDDTTCQAASAPRAMPVSQRFGQRPYGIHDEAVNRWVSTLSMP
jgi:hypothetical protein